MTALVGDGLATGRGWQFYLLAAGIHGLGNYVAVLVQAGIFNGAAALVYIVALTLGLSWAVLRLRSPLGESRSHEGPPVLGARSQA